MSQYKIDKLTPEQEALVPKYQEEWLGIGRSTVSMYDRKTGLQDMYRSINNLYADLKHKQPRIIRCRSPREMCNIAEILKGLWGDGKKVDPRFWDLIKDEKELRKLAEGHVINKDKYNENLNNSWFIQWWAGWRVFYLFCREELGIKYSKEDSKKLDVWIDLCRHVHAFLAFEEVCLVSDFPTVLSWDARNRLSAERGPALAYSDGLEIFVTGGTKITNEKHIDMLFRDGVITPKDVDAETNQEIKTRLINRLGMDKYMADAKTIHKDDYGELIEKQLVSGVRARALKLKNSTPEPDGSFKDYILSVPPNIQRAKEGVAWTYGETEEDFHVTAES